MVGNFTNVQVVRMRKKLTGNCAVKGLLEKGDN
jgi:hypothetical protein